MRTKREYVLIEKDVLKSFIKKANCWDAIVQSAEAMERIDFDAKDWDLLFIEYANGRGVAIPENSTGTCALSLLTDIDLGAIRYE